ncbi:MAG: ABC transporter permease [Acidobacteria bacterium]|nr:ABC transporter permease [Acidobacteriota bacterium]MBI3487111.1 ABC transporter permease [Acidobacteriota bacterium]
MATFLIDFRLALRSLLKSPLFTVTAVLTLALGIGANSAMFSAIRGLLLKPLPYREPERLVALWESRPGQAQPRLPFSAPNFFDWKDAAAAGLEGMSIVSRGTLDLRTGGEPQPVSVLQVSPSFFDLLGARAHLGNTFAPGMDRPGQNQVVVLSQGLWRREFGADPAVVGRSVTLGGQPHTVIGVMPEGFSYPSDHRQDLYTPFPRPLNDEGRGSHGYRAFGRLRPGVSLAAARTELAAIAQNLASLYPATNEGCSAEVRDFRADLLGAGAKPILLLMGAVGLLLLIACTNVANLFLARALSREREVALRAALGANRAQLFSRFLAEGLAIGLVGSALGLLLAALLLKVLPSVLPNTGNLNNVQNLGLDGWALLFTFACSFLVSLAFAAAPAWQLKPSQLNLQLRQGAKGSAAPGRLRSALVVGEVALAMLLLLSAGLLLRSFLKVMDTHPGFEAGGVATFTIELPETRYPQETQQEAFRAELERRLEQLPGVASAGSCQLGPFSGSGASTYVNIGPTSLSHVRWPHQADMNAVSPGFFKSLRIPLLEGRGLEPTDKAGARPVVLVNRTMARTLFPGGSALGQRLMLGVSSQAVPENSLWEIVGVVGDIHQRDLERAPRAMYFVPTSQVAGSPLTFYLRSTASFGALRAGIREQVNGLDRDLALRDFAALEDLVRDSAGDRRQTAILLGVFAALALLLAGIGIYGVVAFSVAQRTREIGIRMALGAQVSQVLSLILGQGLRLAAAGILLGLAGALFTGRLLASQLVGVSAVDPLTSLGVAALLCAIALLSCLAPALKAARVDPGAALRAE